MNTGAVTLAGPCLDTVNRGLGALQTGERWAGLRDPRGPGWLQKGWAARAGGEAQDTAPDQAADRTSGSEVWFCPLFQASYCPPLALFSLLLTWGP